MKKKYLLIAQIIVVGILTASFVFYSLGKKAGLMSQQPNSTTKIFNYFTGKIDKIEDKVLTVSGQLGQADTRSFKVIVNKNTEFIGQFLAKPLFLQSTPAQQSFLSLAELNTGDTIIIKTTLNLSNPSIKEIPALSIQRPAFFDSLYGKLVQVGSDSIVVRAIDPNSLEKIVNTENPAETYLEKDFTVKINSDTQVFSFSLPPENPTKPESKQASFSDLKEDLRVRIYSDTDLTTGDQINAKYIEIDLSPLPPPPAS